MILPSSVTMTMRLPPRCRRTFVITAPYFFLENFQMPDDYYINRYYTNFNRILRWIAFLMASFLPGLYVAIITYHFSMIPENRRKVQLF